MKKTKNKSSLEDYSTDYHFKYDPYWSPFKPVAGPNTGITNSGTTVTWIGTGGYNNTGYYNSFENSVVEKLRLKERLLKKILSGEFSLEEGNKMLGLIDNNDDICTGIAEDLLK